MKRIFKYKNIKQFSLASLNQHNMSDYYEAISL